MMKQKQKQNQHVNQFFISLLHAKYSYANQFNHLVCTMALCDKYHHSHFTLGKSDAETHKKFYKFV